MIQARLDALLRELDAQATSTPSPLAPYREALKSAGEVLAGARLSAYLAKALREGNDVVELVHARARFVDAILQRAWQTHLPATADAALVAVGGYGRGELHPASDVDVLILTAAAPDALGPQIEALVMFLWDIGLEPGHSVRSLADCVEEAGRDITIATNVMESRCLAGSERLFTEMVQLTGPAHIWPADTFFAAKQPGPRAEHQEQPRRAA